MEKIKTKWEELELSNDFIFGKVMRNPKICKEMLERILPDLEIDRIEYIELQKTIKPDIDARSVRLDVFVKDNQDIVYDIEIQTIDTQELPKRSRYYSSMMDLQLIEAGQSYKRLHRSFVIFICLTDVFGKGRHQYTFENICREDTDISLGDGTAKIFLNASGQMDDVSQELKAFLDYINGKKSNDPYVKELEEAVSEAKKNREWRHEYMTLLMRDQENIEKGIQQGIQQGMKQGRSEERIRLLAEALKNGAKAEKLSEMFNIPLGEIREVEIRVLQKEL